jgi:hypothetical protein
LVGGGGSGIGGAIESGLWIGGGVESLWRKEGVSMKNEVQEKEISHISVIYTQTETHTHFYYLYMDDDCRLGKNSNSQVHIYIHIYTYIYISAYIHINTYTIDSRNFH